MQIKAFTVAAALASWATGAAAAPASDASSPGTFHVHGFATLCTESIPQVCQSSFNISLNSLPATRCNVRQGSTNYTFCGTISPEQAYYAFIEAVGGPLGAKFQTSLPGNTDTVLGNTTLSGKRDFDFPATQETKTA